MNAIGGKETGPIIAFLAGVLLGAVGGKALLDKVLEWRAHRVRSELHERLHDSIKSMRFSTCLNLILMAVLLGNLLVHYTALRVWVLAFWTVPNLRAARKAFLSTKWRLRRQFAPEVFGRAIRLEAYAPDSLLVPWLHWALVWFCSWLASIVTYTAFVSW